MVSAAVVNAFASASAWASLTLDPLRWLFWALCLLAVLRLQTASVALFCGQAAPADDPPHGGPPVWLEWPLVLAATLLGAAIRLHGADALPFWWDELLAVWIAGSDLPTLMRTLATPAAPGSDFTPPLFYLLLHGWQALFGQGEMAARVLTGLFGTLTIPALHLLGKRLWSSGAGLAGAFLLALSFCAVSFSQQVRCYSLLGLTAVLFMLALEGHCRKRTLASGALAVLAGTALLYTHFIGAWIFAAVAGGCLAAAVLPPALERLPRRALHGAFALAACLGGFLLVGLNPWFALPHVLADRPLALVFTGLALVAVLALAGLPRAGLATRSLRALSGLTLPLAAPALFFAPWVLGTRIWEVIAGKDAYSPGAYGLAQFAQTFDAFAGLETSATPFLLLLGLLALLVRRPRSGLLVACWTVLVAAAAMYVQNRNMNLTRYLFATQAGYCLLAGVAVAEAVAALAALVRLVRLRLTPSLQVALCLGLCFALFGFMALARVSFPGQTLPSEDYRGVSAFLNAQGDQCLAFENQNLLRGVNWYRQRLGGGSEACTPDAPRRTLFNTYADGQGWAEGSAAVRQTRERSEKTTAFPGISVFKTTAPRLGWALDNAQGATRFMLQGNALLEGMDSGRNLALALTSPAETLFPTGKKLLATASYRLPESLVDPAPVRLTLRLRGQVAGPESRAEASLIGPGGETLLRATCAPTPGYAQEWTQVSSVVPLNGARILLELFDDGSGAIYSSNAGISALELFVEK